MCLQPLLLLLLGPLDKRGAGSEKPLKVRFVVARVFGGLRWSNTLSSHLRCFAQVAHSLWHSHTHLLALHGLEHAEHQMLLHLPLCFGRGSFIDCCALHPGHWSVRAFVPLPEVGGVKVGAAIAIVADGWLARGRILSHFGLPLWQALAGLTKSLPLLWSSLVAIVLCALSVRSACTIFFCQSSWTVGRNLRVATFPIKPIWAKRFHLSMPP